MFMRKILKSVRIGRMKKVAYLLVVTMAIIGVLPDTGNAAIIPADEAGRATSLRDVNVEKIRVLLERKEIANRLSDYGLTPEEVNSRLDRLSDRQVAEIAAQIDKVNSGGDAAGALIGLAVLVLLILLILHFLGYIDLRRNKDKP